MINKTFIEILKKINLRINGFTLTKESGFFKVRFLDSLLFESEIENGEDSVLIFLNGLLLSISFFIKDDLKKELLEQIN